MNRIAIERLVKGVCGRQFALITPQNLVILDGTFTIEQLTTIAQLLSKIDEEPQAEYSEEEE